MDNDDLEDKLEEMLRREACGVSTGRRREGGQDCRVSRTAGMSFVSPERVT